MKTNMKNKNRIPEFIGDQIFMMKIGITVLKMEVIETTDFCVRLRNYNTGKTDWYEKDSFDTLIGDYKIIEWL